MARPLRHPTSDARKALAARFALPYSDNMQDWEWEVADTDRFGEFLMAYQSDKLSDDERLSLMEVLVQCTEDAANTAQFDHFWLALEPLLKSRQSLHLSTIEYWAQLEVTDPVSRFHVSSRMLELLRKGHDNEAPHANRDA